MNPNEEEYFTTCPECDGDGCDYCDNTGNIEISKEESDDIRESYLEDTRDKFRD